MMHTRLLKKIGVGLLLAALLVSSATAETVTYLHTDLLGSVVLETDQNRNVVARYEYEPYGLPRQAVADQPGYTGHVHDAGSGLVYMQQRYYDPEVGQFLSVDPVGVDVATGANFNRYWYANNNPHNLVDPDGRAAACAIPGIMQVCMAAVAKAAALLGGATATKITTGAAVATGVVAVGAIVVQSESGPGDSESAAGGSASGENSESGTRSPAPFIPSDPYSPEETSRRQSGNRAAEDAPSLDPDSVIPDRKPGSDQGGHTVRGRTPHSTGERNVNSNEEHSRRPKGNSNGRKRG